MVTETNDDASKGWIGKKTPTGRRRSWKAQNTRRITRKSWIIKTLGKGCIEETLGKGWIEETLVIGWTVAPKETRSGIKSICVIRKSFIRKKTQRRSRKSRAIKKIRREAKTNWKTRTRLVN